MSFVFVADFFADEILGGGELNNEELISLLSVESSVIRVKSTAATLDFLREHKEKHFIISNFIGLKEECKSYLSEVKYVIYEHDHKYIRSRNPAMYEDYLAPKSEIVNYEFYKNAQAVFCQSAFHAEIVRKNLDLENIVNLGGNLWSEESLERMLEYSKKKKLKKCSIMASNIEHKNTREAVQYCEYKRIPYELIHSSPYYEFLDKLSNNLKLVFFPKTPETLSRIVVEARMMDMGVTTNSRVGASSEDWFEKKGEELISIMRLKRQEILEKVLAAFENE